jgi:hypothetical protein
MTRQQLEDEYDVRNGRIRSPGKFEGEMIYVPFYWDVFLNGCADNDDGRRLVFKVTREDKDQFPELRRRRSVVLIEDEQGFVREL